MPVHPSSSGSPDFALYLSTTTCYFEFAILLAVLRLILKMYSRKKKMSLLLSLLLLTLKFLSSTFLSKFYCKYNGSACYKIPYFLPPSGSPVPGPIGGRHSSWSFVRMSRRLAANRNRATLSAGSAGGTVGSQAC